MYRYMDIVDQFSCEMCGRCCQNTWLVTIDEESYRRNRAWFDKQGRLAEFQQAFRVVTKDQSPGEYAIIEKSRGGCWFLEADHRCRLHKEAGHQHLDAVCQIFPRYPMSTARGLDLTLSLACPAVFRLIERKAPLCIVRSEQLPTPLPPDNYVTQVFPKQKAQLDPLRYYFEIEHHLMDIIQSRHLDLEDRLAFITRTVGRMKELYGNDDIGGHLNRLFRDNYTALETGETDQEIEDMADLSANILIEHFLVNLTFKKIFYNYGLEKAACLLSHFYRCIKKEVSAAQGTSAELAAAKSAIMELEFQFGHNRRAMTLI